MNDYPKCSEELAKQINYRSPTTEKGGKSCGYCIYTDLCAGGGCTSANPEDCRKHKFWSEDYGDLFCHVCDDFRARPEYPETELGNLSRRLDDLKIDQELEPNEETALYIKAYEDIIAIGNESIAKIFELSWIHLSNNGLNRHDVATVLRENKVLGIAEELSDDRMFKVVRYIEEIVDKAQSAEIDALDLKSIDWFFHDNAIHFVVTIPGKFNIFDLRRHTILLDGKKVRIKSIQKVCYCDDDRRIVGIECDLDFSTSSELENYYSKYRKRK